jgi:molybdenum cofactor biosynthesis enzyme MoaA
MNRKALSAACAVAGLILSSISPQTLAGAPSAAQKACKSAVNNNYGGKVKRLRVVSSEFSQANSEVVIDADGERWRCLVSNDGKVQDLSVQSGGSQKSGGVSSAAQSACMSAVNKNYGGKVKELGIVSSEFSQANSEVMINADGKRWRCLVSNDGKVQDLSVKE